MERKQDKEAGRRRRKERGRSEKRLKEEHIKWQKERKSIGGLPGWVAGLLVESK